MERNGKDGKRLIRSPQKCVILHGIELTRSAQLQVPGPLFRLGCLRDPPGRYWEPVGPLTIAVLEFEKWRKIIGKSTNNHGDGILQWECTPKMMEFVVGIRLIGAEIMKSTNWKFPISLVEEGDDEEWTEHCSFDLRPWKIGGTWYKFLYMLYYLSFSYRHNMQLCLCLCLIPISSSLANSTI